MYKSMTTDRAKVWNAMKAKGVSKIVAYFSGGNDEGGVNSYAMFDADGKQFEMPEISKNDPSYARDTYPFTRTELFGHNEYWPKPGSLAHIIEQPVDMEYGSFAGEFSVSGVCTWDLKTKKVTMDGEESAGYESFHKDF